MPGLLVVDPVVGALDLGDTCQTKSWDELLGLCVCVELRRGNPGSPCVSILGMYLGLGSS